MIRIEIENEAGPQMMLVKEGQHPDTGIPLLDLGALDLPADLEKRVRERLWANGIREYADALKPGADEQIMAAVRTALKLSVTDIKLLCQGEYKLLVEAGYG